MKILRILLTLSILSCKEAPTIISKCPAEAFLGYKYGASCHEVESYSSHLVREKILNSDFSYDFKFATGQRELIDSFVSFGAVLERLDTLIVFKANATFSPLCSPVYGFYGMAIHFNEDSIQGNGGVENFSRYIFDLLKEKYGNDYVVTVDTTKLPNKLWRFEYRYKWLCDSKSVTWIEIKYLVGEASQNKIWAGYSLAQYRDYPYLSLEYFDEQKRFKVDEERDKISSEKIDQFRKSNSTKIENIKSKVKGDL